jgi:predicted membrane protein
MDKNNNSLKIIFGIVLVVIGTLLLIDRFGLVFPYNIDIWSIIGTFWPLILIIIGGKLLIERNTTGGLILFILGCVLLLTNLFDFNFFAVLWPLLIIGLGLSILFKGDGCYFNRVSSDEDSDDYIKDSILFWGKERKATSKNFKGGDINVAFGAIELNLRDVKVAKKGAKLNVGVAFGGVEIFVPNNCRVKTSGSVVLGGWDPNLKENDVKEPVLEITGTVILGGVEIKN